MCRPERQLYTLCVLLIQPARIETVSDAFFIVHFLGDAEERAGASLGVLDVTTLSSVGCLVTDPVPQTVCNKCTSHCTAVAVKFV
jgi:hypothetical protein